MGWVKQCSIAWYYILIKTKTKKNKKKKTKKKQMKIFFERHFCQFSGNENNHPRMKKLGPFFKSSNLFISKRLDIGWAGSDLWFIFLSLLSVKINNTRRKVIPYKKLGQSYLELHPLSGKHFQPVLVPDCIYICLAIKLQH